MQLRVTFTSQDPIRLPVAYQHQVQSVIYNALGGTYATFLHDNGYAAGNRAMKLFTFGRLHGAFRLDHGIITFSSPISLELRSPNDVFMLSVSQGLAEGSVHHICGQLLKVVSCKPCTRVIRADELDIVMDSPLTVYRTMANGGTKFYAPGTPEFEELVEVNGRRKCLAWFGKELDGRISLTPLQVQPRDKVVTRYKSFYITAWRGRYRLKAPEPVLDLLYNAGLGAKSSQGFGLFF